MHDLMAMSSLRARLLLLVFFTLLPTFGLILFKGRVNLAAWPYFRRTLESREFAMGDYQVGRVTGKGSANFDYPILDETGRPRPGTGDATPAVADSILEEG